MAKNYKDDLLEEYDRLGSKITNEIIKLIDRVDFLEKENKILMEKIKNGKRT